MFLVRGAGVELFFASNQISNQLERFESCCSRCICPICQEARAYFKNVLRTRATNDDAGIRCQRRSRRVFRAQQSAGGEPC